MGLLRQVREVAAAAEQRGTLPKRWYCHMSPDPLRNSCDAPEEVQQSRNRNSAQELKDRQVRGFLRYWHMRLDAAEREHLPKLQPQPKQSKKQREANSAKVYWVRCCATACGKWRALPRNTTRRRSSTPRGSGSACSTPGTLHGELQRAGGDGGRGIPVLVARRL